MNIAFSYTRFSSEQQTRGDSVRRQTELAEAYAKQHGYVLDTSTYRDLGVSAFKGKNKLEGALGAFLEAVDRKTIPAGSTLLVESLDRLSRESVDTALELFMSIIRRGITIITLQDGQSYSTESIKGNWTKLIMALAVMARAHEESTTKSMRIKAAWQKKRDAGEVLTRICPSWLKWNDGWELVQDKVEIVKRIYQLALDGNGSPTIARILNDEKVPTLGYSAAWSFGTVAAVLNNDAVIGTLVPKKAIAEVTLDYYPAIISKELFAEVRARVKGRKWNGGRHSENVRNLFSGYCYCSECGTKMRSVGSNADHTYMQCLNAYSNMGCPSGRFPYLAAEKTILTRFRSQDRELIAQPQQLEVDHIALFDAELAAEQRKMDNLLKLAEATGDVDQIAIRIIEIKKKIASIAKKKRDVVAPNLTQAMKFEVADWYRQHEQLEGEEKVEMRKKMATSIRRFITRIEMNSAESTVKLYFASGNERVMSIDPFKEKVGGNRRAL